jgi:predicted RNA binding protein YcfA (HicA-like mRNA interferase family)
MNQRLPSVRGDELVRALKRAGFVVVRIKGSHHIVEHLTDPRRRTTVPVHRGKDIKRGLLRKILDDVQLTEEEFRQHL